MNLPNKIKIVKSHDGLPPVGTVMERMDYMDSLGCWYESLEKRLEGAFISIALEAGYAEEVKEQWQAWERVVGGTDFFSINRFISVVECTDDEDEWSNNAFNAGNYFPTIGLAEQARDRILETLKQFHKEHKTQ